MQRSRLQRRQCGGFTLPEVLAAMFVLAVGALGAAGSQAASARLRQHAALESEAVALAASLAARMRVNMAQMALPDAANPYLELDYDAAGGSPSAPPVHCFGSAACDSVQLARFDLHEVEQGVHDAFPGGRIVLCRDAGATSGVLEWSCSGAATAPLVVKIGWRRPGAPGQATPFVAMAVSG